MSIQPPIIKNKMYNYGRTNNYLINNTSSKRIEVDFGRMTFVALLKQYSIFKYLSPIESRI